MLNLVATDSKMLVCIVYKNFFPQNVIVQSYGCVLYTNNYSSGVSSVKNPVTMTTSTINKTFVYVKKDGLRDITLQKE